jgi:cellulose synthase/poly-beta-1,6-N-acetylglucosamine synthase-like glycosyltransferase
MISVVVTVFQQAASLIPMLHCLSAQTLDEKFEIIICDDGSAEWALQNAIEDPGLRELDIRYIWQSKNGHRASRSKNNGLHCASGDIVVMLDGDILVKPDFLSRHRSAHTRPRQFVCNPRKWVVGENEVASNASSAVQSQAPFLFRLADLARNNRPDMFALLDRVSLEFDRQSQRDFARSSSPWMACLGFSFSFDRAANRCLYFDERFEGWGPEDREFVLRMVSAAGYEVSYHDDIVVYHLEACSTGRTPFAPLPKEHAKIVSYLKNMIYFRDSYPAHDLSQLMNLLLYFRLDANTNTWQLIPSVKPLTFTSGVLENQLQIIRRWLHTKTFASAPRASSGRDRYYLL